MQYDAIVIGTGFGGAVTACRLAQGGLTVLVLERGRRFGAADFPDLPAPEAVLPDFDRWLWQSHRGLWDLRDLGPIVSAQAAGYGGGSLIYANVQLRPPAEVFAAWPEGYDREQLREFYDLAGWMLDIAPIDHSPVLSQLRKTRGFDAAARELGRAHATIHPPLAVRFSDGENAFGRPLSACTGCGKCCLGCTHQAKNSLDHNYLANAEQYPDVEIRTRCEVQLVHELDEGYVVEYQDELAGNQRVEATGRFVFVCAGCVGTMQLLARSRAHAERRTQSELRGLPRVSAALGSGYFANGDAVSLVFDTAAAHEPTHGPTITTSTFHRDADGFLLVQDGGYPAEMARAASVFGAPAWLARNRHRQRASAVELRSRAGSEEPVSPSSSRQQKQQLQSPVDALSLAIGSGALDATLPPQLRDAVSAVQAELLRDTRAEFAELVDGLIEQSVAAFLSRASQRRLRKGTALHGWLMQQGRRLTLRFLADREQLVDYAQHAFFKRFGLTEARATLPRAVARLFGSDVRHAPRGTVLLAMGRDQACTLHYDATRDALRFRPGTRPDFDVLGKGELLQQDMAAAMGGELRTSPLSALSGKPMTVHSQGGCSMAMTAADGVTSPEGEVHGHPGLFIADASLFPSSVGVNPSATVLAVAERNVLGFLRRLQANPRWPEGDARAGAAQLREQRRRAQVWARTVAADFALAPPEVPSPPVVSQPLGLQFREHFSGHLSPTAHEPRGEADFYELESAHAARATYRANLQMEIPDFARFWRDPEHRARVRGSLALTRHDSPELESFAVDGHLRLLIAPEAAPELPGGTSGRLMVYELRLARGAESTRLLHMYKRIPGVLDRFTWRSTARCFSRLYDGRGGLEAAGMLQIDLSRFLFETLPSLHVTGTTDPARVLWVLGSFAQFFLGGLSADTMGRLQRFAAATVREASA